MKGEEKVFAIIAILVSIVIVGSQACVIVTNRQCEETRRAALASPDPSTRASVLAQRCEDGR